MRHGGWISLGTAVYGLALCSGCVSLDEFKRIQAANRQLAADKEKVGQDLFDERNVNDQFRNRIKHLETEVATKDELIGNYRREIDGNAKMSDATRKALEEMAGKSLAPITIVGAKLPAPLDNALKKFAEEHPGEVAYDAAHGSDCPAAAHV